MTPLSIQHSTHKSVKLSVLLTLFGFFVAQKAVITGQRYQRISLMS